MNDGEIIQFDTPEKILRHPKNDFVRGFIGEDRLHEGNDVHPVAKDLMIEKVITAKPNRGLAQALKTMKTYKVDSLLVTNNRNNLLGIATLDLVEQYFTDEDKTITDIIKRYYMTVEADCPYREVAEIFAGGVASIPVLQNGRLVGVITRSSMMRGLAGMKMAASGEGGTVNES